MTLLLPWFSVKFGDMDAWGEAALLPPPRLGVWGPITALHSAIQPSSAFCSPPVVPPTRNLHGSLRVVTRVPIAEGLRVSIADCPLSTLHLSTMDDSFHTSTTSTAKSTTNSPTGKCPDSQIPKTDWHATAAMDKNFGARDRTVKAPVNDVCGPMLHASSVHAKSEHHQP